MLGQKRKKELCLELAKSYREIADKEWKMLFEGPMGLYEKMSEDLTNANDRLKENLGTISCYGFLGLCMGHSDTIKRAEKYEKLANSKKLYIPGLVRLAKLKKELYEISTPVGL